jgi:hypothetical protein
MAAKTSRFNVIIPVKRKRNQIFLSNVGRSETLKYEDKFGHTGTILYSTEKEWHVPELGYESWPKAELIEQMIQHGYKIFVERTKIAK